ncbi:MAG TPA: SDR family oxidoreductase [Acidimicrobiales bacterium]
MSEATLSSAPRSALVTGASKGLGLALARSLVADGWTVVVDARHGAALDEAVGALGPGVVAVPGDIGDATHRRSLAAAAEQIGGLDLVVLSAGTLGPSPLPALADLALEDLRRTLEVNLVAQLGVIQAVLPHLRPGVAIVAVTSDAAVEPYEGWGAYAASKAGFEQLAAVLGAERPDLRVLRIDPGDLRTDMHQAAFPGEDISDRPRPEAVVPALRTILDQPFPTGRYQASDVAVTREVA